MSASSGLPGTGVRPDRRGSGDGVVERPLVVGWSIPLRGVEEVVNGGTATNPAAVGQVWGRSGRGLGFGCMERYRFVEAVPQTPSLETCLIPTVLDVSEIDVLIVESATSAGAFGVKVLAPVVLVMTAPAIAARIKDTSGVEIGEVPATSESVFRMTEDGIAPVEGPARNSELSVRDLALGPGHKSLAPDQWISLSRVVAPKGKEGYRKLGGHFKMTMSIVALAWRRTVDDARMLAEVRPTAGSVASTVMRCLEAELEGTPSVGRGREGAGYRHLLGRASDRRRQGPRLVSQRGSRGPLGRGAARRGGWCSDVGGPRSARCVPASPTTWVRPPNHA